MTRSHYGRGFETEREIERDEVKLEDMPQRAIPASNSGQSNPSTASSRPSRLDLDHLKNKMLANGYCIRQVQYLAQTFDIDTLTYLSLLKRSPMRQKSHAKCSPEGCIAYNVDMAKYKTRHITADCNCEMIGVPYEELIDIIQRGDVPLVSVIQSPDRASGITVKLSTRNKNSAYVAVSHVWADGLGNPKSNSLPVCQLRRFENSGLFWMDTLCIPVKKEHSDLRIASIMAMASIYVGASSALVLDAELMRTEAGTDESLARLIGSVWMCRSWTLQEGILPTSCEILFADRSLYFQSYKDASLCWKIRMGWARPPRHAWNIHILEETTSTSTPSLTRTLKEHLQFRFFNLRELQRFKRQRFDRTYTDAISGSRQHDIQPLLEVTVGSTQHVQSVAWTFVAVWNDFTGRSTTKTEDLHLILANILQLDCGPLLELPVEKRLQSILFSLPQIPLSLFFNTGKRLKSEVYPKNQWVPLEVDGHFLSHGSFLDFVDPNHINETRLRLVPTEDTRCLFVKAVVHPTDAVFTVQLDGPGLGSVQVKCFADQPLQHRLQSVKATCIIFEQSSAFARVRSGAMFYVLSSDEDSQGTPTPRNHSLDGSPVKERMSLVFQCPVMLRYSDQSSYAVSMSRIKTFPGIDFRPSGAQIFVEYDPMLHLPRLEELIVELPQSGTTFAELLRILGTFLRSKYFSWYYTFVLFIAAIEIILEAFFLLGLPLATGGVREFVRIFLGFLLLGYVPLFLVVALYYFIRYHHAQNTGPYWNYVRSFMPRQKDPHARGTGSFWERIKSYWPRRRVSRSGAYISLSENDGDDGFVRTDSIA